MKINELNEANFGCTVFVPLHKEGRLMPIPACPSLMGVELKDTRLMAKLYNRRTSKTFYEPLDNIYLSKDKAQEVIFAEKAREKFSSFNMSYSFGYDENGNETVGLRSVESLFLCDCYWLVSGEVFLDGKQLNSVREICEHLTDAKEMTVDVYMQSLVFGKMFQVKAGTWKVTANNWNHGTDYCKSGILSLSYK